MMEVDIYQELKEINHEVKDINHKLDKSGVNLEHVTEQVKDNTDNISILKRFRTKILAIVGAAHAATIVVISIIVILI